MWQMNLGSIERAFSCSGADGTGHLPIYHHFLSMTKNQRAQVDLSLCTVQEMFTLIPMQKYVYSAPSSLVYP
jgi:hypothetical protein